MEATSHPTISRRDTCSISSGSLTKLRPLRIALRDQAQPLPPERRRKWRLPALPPPHFHDASRTFLGRAVIDVRTRPKHLASFRLKNNRLMPLPTKHHWNSSVRKTLGWQSRPEGNSLSPSGRS